MSKDGKGIKELFEEVIDKGLCTGCGACITRCPYIALFEGRIVVLDNCNIEEGDCYKHCPRTYTDMNGISSKLFGVPYGDQEVGYALNILMARSRDKEIKEKGQDGGIVTTLLSLALKEGIIDTIICTKMDEDKLPHGYVVRNRNQLLQCGGSSYESSFALEAYRGIPKDSTERLALVGVGCQIEGLGKMRIDPPRNSVSASNVRLTLGLFCGWALRPKIFHPYLREHFNLSETVKFDIPHSPNYTFDVHTNSGIKSVNLDDIRPFINPACRYCWDMTAEFSDISIGSAGSAFRGWNTVIIRTEAGDELVKLAKARGILETQALPDQRLSHLKSVALKRKRTAFKNIFERTHDKANLLYVGGLTKDLIEKFLED